jgi:hypothetical protein
MNTIKSVPADAYSKVQLLAHAWEVSNGEVVARLVEHFGKAPVADTSERNNSDSAAPIYVVYEATRIEATFDRATKAVTITSGKLEDKTYATPSGAAVAVVSAYNPSINPNRNGWTFWYLAVNGELLQTIRK